jgi:hypothetical protein
MTLYAYHLFEDCRVMAEVLGSPDKYYASSGRISGAPFPSSSLSKEQLEDAVHYKFAPTGVTILNQQFKSYKE